MSDYLSLVPPPPGFIVCAPSSPPVPLYKPFVLPVGYGYVTLTGVFSSFLVFWKNCRLTAARKDFGVPSPQMFCEKSNMFNCILRAYQSTLEIYPSFLFLLLIGGLEMPHFCATGGLIWILGRFTYAKQYYLGEPRIRFNGSVHVLGHLMLLIAALRFSIKRLVR